MKTLCAYLDAAWLGAAMLTAGAVFAAVNLSLWQATALLPAFIVFAAFAHRLGKR